MSDTSLPDDVPIDTISVAVERLTELGLSPETIAYTLDQPVGKIRATLTFKRRIVSDADQELRDNARSLAELAISKARKMLLWGPPEVQLTIIRSLLTGSTKLINTGQEAGIAETRVALDTLLQESRDVQQREIIVTDSEIIDVPIDPVPQRVPHPSTLPALVAEITNAVTPSPAPKAVDDQNGETWLSET